MRILVLGATGYVGSRVVPALLEAGHKVVAASSSEPDPERFAWGDDVDWVRCDVTDAEAVRTALTDVDGVCYLVHSLDERAFRDRDREGAETVRDALADSDVRRVVYLSGLVPDVPAEDLSQHIASRLEVEETLAQAASADRTVLALRAGVVIGAGSTSFEVIRQLASLLLVQPIPERLAHKVQPIAVSDVMRAMVEAFPVTGQGQGLAREAGAVDIGGPDVRAYSEMLTDFADAAGLRRAQVPTPPVPAPLVSLGAAAMSTAPFWTVNALVDSLRHDMVCRPDHTWVPHDGLPLMGVNEAMKLALGPEETASEAALPSDSDGGMRAPVLDEIKAPTTVRAAGSLVWSRLQALRRAGS